MAAQPTPEARQDYNSLIELLMPSAEQMLKKHGEFFPFGATVSTEGEVKACAAYNGDEQPPSEQVIALLTQGFQAEARDRKVRATGICYDGRIVQDGKKVDAVILLDRLDRLVDAISISQRSRAIALQSVLAGMGLSLAGMIVAAFGYLPPLAGALFQEAIDVAVILNALRALGAGRERLPPVTARTTLLEPGTS